MYSTMKKTGFWLFAVGALFAVSGVYALVSGTEGGLLTLAISAVLLFFGFRKHKAAKPAAAPSGPFLKSR